MKQQIKLGLFLQFIGLLCYIAVGIAIYLMHGRIIPMIVLPLTMGAILFAHLLAVLIIEPLADRWGI